MGPGQMEPLLQPFIEWLLQAPEWNPRHVKGAPVFFFLSVSRSSENVLLVFTFCDKLYELNKFSSINYFLVRIFKINSSFTSWRIGSQVIAVIVKFSMSLFFSFVSVQPFFLFFPYCVRKQNLHPHFILSL